MDELRELALQTFRQRSFSPIGGIVGYHFLQLSADQQDYILHESVINEKELPIILEGTTNSKHPSLTFFQIPMDRAQSLQITRAAFLHLITAIGFDPQVLYLLTHNYDDYHHLTGYDTAATDYLGTSRFSLTWTRHLESQSTIALVLVRRDSPFPELLHLANTYRNHLANPRLLPFLAVIYITRVVDRSTAQVLEKIHYVETCTGYGPNNPISPSTRFNITGWRKSGLCERTFPINTDNSTSFDKSSHRSRKLFALLTHEDAAASTDLAEASKRDSSAMKAITILTMLFLPATFFATLFMVPTLRWDREDVIQRRFWVYWALTIPTMALVFGLWGGMLNMECIRKWVAEVVV
ncbi:uncharacterized protein BO80DRAFT_467229 [Aspergillus ibericus CBS 121593]|uniref:Uncharacterized protein n=1 Tax=Aspergillus ibericus CBS 121593 TaxID=1448316 RepID=A0A395GSA4_9EURO|nr:hypothetical protein BO80DRAFT_467229 [Aspergillus ibericus CBS 121593]RAK98094.1 hypothetical protein BO80DRAFT_467229 [Aspergillus ibericus CBS 121593]